MNAYGRASCICAAWFHMFHTAEIAGPIPEWPGETHFLMEFLKANDVVVFDKSAAMIVSVPWKFVRKSQTQ